MPILSGLADEKTQGTSSGICFPVGRLTKFKTIYSVQCATIDLVHNNVRFLVQVQLCGQCILQNVDSDMLEISSKCHF